MRNSSTVSLYIGCDVVVFEARVIDLRRILQLIPENFTEVSIPTYLQQHLADLLTVLSDCISLPIGMSINDLSVSESEIILGAWWQLHSDFFQRALVAFNLTADHAASAASNPLTIPLRAFQSAATTSHGTGDGGIS